MNSLSNLISRYFVWIILGINLLVFGQVMRHQLVWDDHAFIINQNHVKFPSITEIVNGSFPVPDTGSYRPVRNLVYALTLPVFKTNPGYHHTFILTLHIISSLLVYFLLKKIIKNPDAVQISALLFTLHPIHTESINWVTAGYDLIFVCLYLGALLSHLESQSSKIGKPWYTYLLVFLAMLSNEIALTLPLVIILIDYSIYRLDLRQTAHRVKYGLYFLLAGLYWLIRMVFITENPFTVTVYPSLIGNLKLGLFLFGQYIIQLLAPLNLSVDRFFIPGLTGLYSLNHSLALPPPILNFADQAVFVPVLIGLFWLMAAFGALLKKSPYALPLLWVPLSLLAVLRIVPLPAIYSERYAYLASVGFVILAGLILRVLLIKPAVKSLVIILVGLVLVSYVHPSYRRSQDWRDDYVLWSKTLGQNPESASSASSLGVQYFLMGDLDNSLKYHRQSITQNPYVSSYQQNYVSILVKLKRYDDIIDFINLILKTDAKNVNLYTILASTYDAKGEYQPAMANYQKAYDLSPNGSPTRAEIEKLVEALDRKYQVVDENL